MKSVYIVDCVDCGTGDVTQRGHTCASYEEARELFANELKSDGFFDDWDGISGVYTTTDYLLVVREINLP